jgi:hypothetical protein
MATRVIRGIDNITSTITRFQRNIKKEWCACADPSIPAFSMSGKIKQGYIDAKGRGVRIRYVTQITKGNLVHCKELTKYVQLRHLDSVKASFAVSESEFVAGIRSGKTLDRLVCSDSPEVVAHQRAAFETLWENAVSARRRMGELK